MVDAYIGDASLAMPISSQLPCRSKLSISIGYNDALVTIGYCGEPQRISLADLKEMLARARMHRVCSCMQVATAMSGRAIGCAR